MAAAANAGNEAVVAANEQHRQRMRELESRQPVADAKVTAISETIGAIGAFTAGPDGHLVFVSNRREDALNAARKKYGDTFVDWILAREEKIKATLIR